MCNCAEDRRHKDVQTNIQTGKKTRYATKYGKRRMGESGGTRWRRVKTRKRRKRRKKKKRREGGGGGRVSDFKKFHSQFVFKHMF